MTLIMQLCSPDEYSDVQNLIDETINEDITYQKQPLDLRNQRTYAVKVGLRLLDLHTVITDRKSPCSQGLMASSTSLDRHTKRRIRTLISSSQSWVVV